MKSASCMLHGVLHLLGMDHETDNGQMKRSRTSLAQKTRDFPNAIDRARRRGATIQQ